MCGLRDEEKTTDELLFEIIGALRKNWNCWCGELIAGVHTDQCKQAQEAYARLMERTGRGSHAGALRERLR